MCPSYRIAVKIGAALVWFVCILGVLGDLGNLQDLWTFGGKVGMARPTIFVTAILAACIFLLSCNGGGGPFYPPPER